MVPAKQELGSPNVTGKYKPVGQSAPIKDTSLFCGLLIKFRLYIMSLDHLQNLVGR